MLALRGTETTSDRLVDLFSADLGQIGLLGLALKQVVSMANYVARLKQPKDAFVPQIRVEARTTRPTDPRERFVTVEGKSLDEPIYLVLSDAAAATGLGLITANEKVTLTGHSLGGHLAAIAAMLFPDVFEQDVVVFNPAGYDPSTANLLQLLQRFVPFAGMSAGALVESTKAWMALELGGAALHLATTANQLVTTSDILLKINGQLGRSVPQGSPNVIFVASEDLASGDDTNLVASIVTNADRYGPRTNIITEENNHTIEPLMDALALQALIEPMRGFGFQANDLIRVLEASSNRTAHSYEAFAEGLFRLFRKGETFLGDGAGNGGGNFLPTSDERSLFFIGVGKIGARNAFHDPVLRTKQAIDSTPGLTLLSLADMPAGSLKELAISGGEDPYAYRYALRALNPFVVFGADQLYAPHNSRGELELYTSPDETPAGMTDEYLTDRSQFLEAKSAVNTTDELGIHIAGQLENWRYFDLALSYSVTTFGDDAVPAAHIVLFGDELPNELVGQSLADRLYGGLAGDVLFGGLDNDYLEGGEGRDVYQYTASTPRFGQPVNDGADDIRDTDGRGVIQYTYTHPGPLFSTITETRLIGGIALAIADGQWRSADAKFVYREQVHGLSIEINGDAGGSIHVLDFDFQKARREGYFGIRFIDVPTPPETIETIAGDRVPAAPPTLDALGNLQLTATPDIGRNDTLNDSAGMDLVEPGAGNDIVNAFRGGSDWIRGGGGRDWITDTGGGNDFIEGGGDTGIGGDVVYAGPADDVVFGGERPLDLATYLGVLSDPDALGGVLRGEFLSGGAGSDFMFAGAESDAMMGGGGSDVIVAGPGNDVIFGDADFRANTLNWSFFAEDTGTGRFSFDVSGVANPEDGEADTLLAGAGDDWVGAGRGDDFVDASSGNDVVLGEAGSDVISTGTGNDLAYGDLSTVTFPAEHGEDVIDLGAGRDVGFGDGASDILFGGDGDDILYGDNESIALAFHGSDLLDGGAGDDVLRGQGGDDTLIGGPGHDQLIGGAGKDTYIFNRGDGVEVVFDTPDDASGADASIVRFGAEIVRGQVKFRPGSLFIDVGGGEGIHLEGWERFNPDAVPILDRLEFADGEVMTYQDVLAQGFDIDGTEEDDDGHDAGHPALVGTAFRDHIRGYGGNDRLFGIEGDDELLGGSGADALRGGEGADHLEGGDGEDALWGDAGDDYLDGGAGSDFLLGGAGNDLYVFGAGDHAFDYLGDSTIVFDDGVSAADVYLRRQLINGSPVYSIALGAGAVDSEKFFISLASNEQLSAFAFADGTVLDRNALLRDTWVDQAHLTAGADGGSLEGYAGNDFLQGGAGDDVLAGWRGNDRLQGGAGADILDGGLGNDLLTGGEDADTLIGGAGDDELIGEGGGDTYVYTAGGGTDVISESDSSDVLSFIDIASTDVVFARHASGDLVATVAGGGSVTISGFYDAGEPRIARVDFADDVSVSGEALAQLALAPITGTAGSDVIAGTPYADTVQAGAGDDDLDGAGGEDVLEGGTGIDTYRLRPNGGADVLIEDGTHASIIELAAGWTFSDLAAHRSGDDLLLSLKNGNSSQRLPGYYTGQVAWTVRTADGEVKTAAQLIDYLAAIEPPHTASEVRADFIDWARQRYQAYLASFGATGGLRFHPQPFNDEPYIAFEAPFGETGSTGTWFLNIAEITAGGSPNVLDLFHNVIADAGGGNDLISNRGSTFGATLMTQNDASVGSFLYGNDGDDSVLGTWSNDWLLGGKGNDYLAGSMGNDTYVVLAAESGTKIIDEVNEYLVIQGYGDNQPGRFSTDTLLFADIPYSAVTFGLGEFNSSATSLGGHAQMFATLDISWEGGAARVLLPDPNHPYLFQFPGQTFGMETIRFADGRTITQNEILPYVSRPTSGTPGSDATMNGTAGDDFLVVPFPNYTFQRTTLHGFGSNDRLIGGQQNDVLEGGDGDDFLGAWDGNDLVFGGAGNDFIEAEAGNDYIEGGTGNDHMNGGPGADTYVFAPCFGRDVVTDFAPLGLDTNVIRFEEGIAPSQIGVTRSGSSLYLIDSATAGRVILFLAAPGGQEGWGVSRVEFADGTVWTRAELLDRMGAVPGTASGDVIGGSDAADVVHGLEGDDDLQGYAGDDVLYGDAGDDFIEGDPGRDVMFGGDGADDIEDWEDSNFIHAGAGDDYVYTEAAPNFVIGGTGADWIDVWAADSVIAFNRGDGDDTVYAAEGFTLSLGGGITAADVTLAADGMDALVQTGDETVRLSRQWEMDPQAWPTLRLQLVGEDVRIYDLALLIGQLSAYGGTIRLTGVNPVHAGFSEAYGGDLAYEYAKARLGEQVSPAVALAVIGASAFGTTLQAVSNPVGPPVMGRGAVTGTAASESIAGSNGADLVNGGGGDDVLAGGPGDDFLFGGAGADTYLYNLGDGIDTVADLSSPQAPNTLSFGPGIDAGMLSLGLGSLLLRIGDAGAIHFESFDPANVVGARDADRFVFADGTSITYEELVARGFDIAGSEGDDVLEGTSVVDRMRGGSGDDVLTGGRGGDSYLYAPGDGADVIIEAQDTDAVDVLRFAAGIDAASISAARASDDLVLTLSAPGDSVALADWYGSGPGIELVSFADGTTWDAAYLQSLVQTNRAPQLAAPIAHQVASEDAAFTFAVPTSAFVDPDGDTLSYAATVPAWLVFDGATFTGTPSQADVGAFEIRIVASDEAGLSAEDTFSLTVADVNDAPTRSAPLADHAAMEDLAFSFTLPTGAFADEDGDALTYSATRPDGSSLPGWLAFDAASRTFSGEPANADVGSLDILVIAADGAGAMASDVFTLTVVNVNDQPVLLNPIADQSAAEDAGFTFQLPADSLVDADAGDALIWTVDSLPAWLNFDAASRTLWGTPTNSDVGATEVQVTATDAAGLYASDAFVVNALNTNDVPTLEFVLVDRTTAEDEPFTLALPDGMFADVDAGDTLTLSARLSGGEALPAWISFDPALQTFAGTPRNSDVGTHRIRVTAVDIPGASVHADFGVTVTNVNDAPLVAQPVGLVAFEAGSTFVYTIPAGTFADEDAGDHLDFSAAMFDGQPLPAWLDFDASTATFMGSPAATLNGVLHLAVTATDVSGLRAVDDFGLVIHARSGDTVKGRSGDDLLFGGTGDETLQAKGGNDALFGGLGNDMLKGGTGNDLLQGGDGNDVLRGGSGNELLDGGAGNDLIVGGKGDELIVGGLGNDVIRTGRGHDVIAFNRGDGFDTIFSDGRGDNTLSLGGGIRYDDLSFSKEGKDLIIGTGGDDRILMKDWYGGDKQNLLTLQIILDATADFDAASSDPLLNRRVQTFGFAGLVNEFDQARAESPGLTSWALTNALLDFHLAASDDAALGGDLTYWFGRNRSLAGIGIRAAQEVIGAPGFGSDAQTLRPFSGLQEGLVRLA